MQRLHGSQRCQTTGRGEGKGISRGLSPTLTKATDSHPKGSGVWVAPLSLSQIVPGIQEICCMGSPVPTSIGQGFECLHGPWDPKGGELYHSTAKPWETVVEAGPLF